MFIITGGGTGIGRALTQFLATQCNKDVLIIGRHQETLGETASTSPRIRYVTADVSSHEGRESILAALRSTDILEGLVHNAGVISPIEVLGNIDEEAWKETFNTNLHAPLFLTQQLLPRLENNQGRVLMIGSGAAHFPVHGWSAYCSSKAALSMLTQCFQLECSQIGFASVMPGIVDTKMQTLIRHSSQMEASKRDFFKQLKETNRLLSPEIVAQFLAWLLLDTSKEIFRSQEWDIYDERHHGFWLQNPLDLPHFDVDHN